MVVGAGYSVKFQRAEEHIAAFAEAERAFFEEHPILLFPQEEPDGAILYIVEELEPPPQTLSLVAGDALQNLRSSLDYCTWDLVAACGSTPSVRTSFPIRKQRADFEKDRGDALAGMDDEIIRQIEGFQPFTRNRPEITELWILNDLARIDRHRHLNVVAPSAMAVLFSSAIPMPPNDDFSATTGPLRKGSVVARVPPGIGVQIAQAVGFSEEVDPIVGQYSALRLLWRLKDEVRRILGYFEATWLAS